MQQIDFKLINDLALHTHTQLFFGTAFCNIQWHVFIPPKKSTQSHPVSGGHELKKMKYKHTNV